MNSSIWKKLGIILGLAILLTLFIRPERNAGEAYGANDYTHSTQVPPIVKTALEKACFDCHSNHTNYAWFNTLPVIEYWINHHITEGKEELNLSEWENYKPKRKAHKMEEIAEMLEEDEMPLPSYLLMHGEAKLSAEEKTEIIAWAKSQHDILKAQIPAGENNGEKHEHEHEGH